MAIRDASGQVITDPKILNKFKGKMQPTGFSINPSGSTVSGKILSPQDQQEQSLRLQNLQISNQKGRKELQKTDIETGKIPAAQLGYYTMATASVNDYENKIRKPLEKGELTYKDIKEAYFKTPTDKTSILNTALYAGADAWLRIQTGAQANPSEIQREMDKYKPRPWDSDKAIENKFKSLFVDRLARYKQNLEENVGKTSGNSATKKTIKLPSGKTMVIGE